MKSEELIHHLGYSIKSKELKTTLEKFGVSQNPKGTVDVKGNTYDAKTTNEAETITVTFDGYNRYLRHFGEPSTVINTTDDELILKEIDFLMN